MFHPGSKAPMPLYEHDAPDLGQSALYLASPIQPHIAQPTIFIVDNDAAVRDALSLTLRAGGFGVAPFGSAKELLSNAPNERAGCLLIEYDLKDMTGIELVECLYARRIDFPAVIMSARLKRPVFENPGPPGIVAVLQKPFGQEALLRCIRKALDHL